MKKIFSIRLWTVLSTILATLLIVLNIGTNVARANAPIINVTLGIETSRIVDDGTGTEDTEYFKVDIKEKEDVQSFADQACYEVEAEGLVLLKNDNNALPLAEGSKVSLFGMGSGYINNSEQGQRNSDGKTDFINLKDALELDNKFTVNSELWNLVATNTTYGAKKALDSKIGIQVYKINEAPWSFYNAQSSTFSTYGDAAIVVFTRDATEGSDVSAMNSDGANEDYLQLHENEKAILTNLTTLKTHGTFKKIIVLLNSAVHLQLDFLDDPAIDVDACMWIGNTGMSGIRAVADALAGRVNPSGRMADTLVKDNFSAPAMASLSYNENKIFARKWSNDNLNATNNTYGVYVEGIYVGYRYYETRYTDVVEARSNVGAFEYDEVVAYPFGYGLSYTSFEYGNFKVTENTGNKTYEVSVTVTNTGDVAGKEVVQVYLQKPYNNYAIRYYMEVAAVELVGYAKTKTLEPGASETVVISVEKEDLASYDAFGAGTYILNSGDYYLTAAYNAHSAANNILAKKGITSGMRGEGNSDLVSNDFIVVTSVDAETYSVSGETGATIENRLDNIDIMSYSGAGNNNITYVSRSDWQGTYPNKAANINLTNKMVEDLQNVDANSVNSEGSLPTFGEENGLTLAMLRGKDYKDPLWDKLLNQLSFEELNTLLTTALCQTAEIESVVKPRTREQDGPTFCKESNVYKDKMYTRFPCEGIWAASFNDEAIAKVAKAIAFESAYQDDTFLRFTGMYAPGLNIHRLNHGGRNHEYFSEDPYLVGIAGQTVIKTFQTYGIIAFPKHFILNDQEINRSGISVWVNEQTAREIYLKPWKYALAPERGNSHAIMSAFNRAGTKWASAEKSLIDIIRDEFGFDGFILTDMADSNGVPYMKTLDGILAGTDAWLSNGNDHSFNAYKNNATVVNLMRESAHRIMYVTANYSIVMNGVSTTARVEFLSVWWETALVTALIIIFVLTICSVALLVASLILKKKS